MDIKSEVEKIIKNLTSDKDLLSKFQKSPAETIKSMSGVNIPAGAMDEAVKLVKAGLPKNSVVDKAVDALKNIF
ncbi:MAG TPA: hypothetical protein DCX21_06730 [Eubacterium sp.]|nr:hypothetical protein [Eubacterium sp.]